MGNGYGTNGYNGMNGQLSSYSMPQSHISFQTGNTFELRSLGGELAIRRASLTQSNEGKIGVKDCTIPFRIEANRVYV